MRHLVTIQRVTETQDATGDPQESWSDVATVNAAYEGLTAQEFYTGRQRQGEHRARFVLHYRGDVVPKMRLIWEGRTFEIEGPFDPHGRRRELTVLATEVI